MKAFASHSLECRPVDTVMDLDRLGTLYPYPLSFMRCLVRKIMSGGWAIARSKFDLDENGYGEAVYKVDTGEGVYSFVVFSHYLDPAERSDRVIAEKWDMTATLCAGDLPEDRLAHLRANVPLQEAGRVDPNCMVLTRANKSSRNFDYVVDGLVRGEQPDLDVIAKVGYIFRTTAVYGSGKFGMADWEKVCLRFPEFASPFMAEMLVCYLIRQFSLELTDWVAKAKGATITLADDIKRYIGIGNATGLGMAPYLITHPRLISNWIHIRESALRRVLENDITDGKFYEFLATAQKAVQHLSEIDTDNVEQNKLNATARQQASSLISWTDNNRPATWQTIIEHAAKTCEFETQELINSVLLEVYRGQIYDLQSQLGEEEVYRLKPAMPLGDLKAIIETHYDWALSEDYDGPDCIDTFWYRSEEKMEPRLGRRSQEPGAEKEMLLGVGYAVKCCFDDMKNIDETQSTAQFVFENPKHRYIIRRMQTMAESQCGEIRANLLDADVLPIQLLRCKLSFFGVGKFDPRSRLWVRNTMFQGAPITTDMGKPFRDDWCFPVRPNV